MSWAAERTDEFDEWWEGLADQEQRKVVAFGGGLAGAWPERGPTARRHRRGSKHPNMKELRITQTMRVFFAFDPERRSTKMPKEKRKPFSELSKEVRKRPGAAAEIDARKRAIVSAVRLAELRQQIGKTQTELAQVLEMTQANVSRIEHSENLYLRTLADYVGALGGHIEVNAVFDNDIVPLGLVEKDRGSAAA